MVFILQIIFLLLKSFLTGFFHASDFFFAPLFLLLQPHVFALQLLVVLQDQIGTVHFHDLFALLLHFLQRLLQR